MFLSYIAPMVLWQTIVSDEMLRIQEAQALIIEQQQIIEEEKRKEEEYQEDLHETMTEWFIHRMESLYWIKYTLWWFDIEKKKFDCVWLFKAYAMMRWLLSYDEAKYINSYVMTHLWEEKSIRDAVRWDVTYWHPLWDDYRHIAMVTRDYDESEWWLWIIDNLWTKPQERFIRLSRRNTYLWRWKIELHTSPFVAIANNKELKYEPLWSYEGMYNLSRYYAPIEWQENYFAENYEQEYKMNCSGDCFVTANWYRLWKDDVEKIAACPPNYPFWTELRIEDWITIECQDRWWAIQWKRLDIRAGIGQSWRNNIAYQRVVTGRRNIYKKNLHSKPINEPKKILRVLDSRGNYDYITRR